MQISNGSLLRPIANRRCSDRAAGQFYDRAACPHGNWRVIQITKRTQFANELRVRGQCNPLSNYARFLGGFFSRTPGPHPILFGEFDPGGFECVANHQGARFLLQQSWLALMNAANDLAPRMLWRRHNVAYVGSRKLGSFRKNDLSIVLLDTSFARALRCASWIVS
jgi:hypothetical protein